MTRRNDGCDDGDERYDRWKDDRPSDAEVRAAALRLLDQMESAGDEPLCAPLLPIEEEEPEIREPCLAQCHYCGALFHVADLASAADDCGSCRLTGEDLEAYARDLAREREDGAA